MEGGTMLAFPAVSGVLGAHAVVSCRMRFCPKACVARYPLFRSHANTT